MADISQIGPEPDVRCSRHVEERAYYPCVACSTQREIWLDWHRERRKVQQAAAAEGLERFKQARLQGIDDCQLCDEHGWHNGAPCHHDPQAPNRAIKGAQACREALQQ